MSQTRRTPRESRSLRQICDRPSDNYRYEDFSILIDVGTVHLTEQRAGESPTQQFDLSRAEFNRLIDWYNNGERIRRSKVSK